MKHRKAGRLVVLSGPSCAGKTPLYRGLARCYPHLHQRLHKLVLFNSRSPRPGESDGVDYHFRQLAAIEAMQSDSRFAVLQVRGDTQALDLEDLAEVLERGDALYEGNPAMARLLMTLPQVRGAQRLSVFLAPFSREEIQFLKTPNAGCHLQDLITDVMRRKLLRRARRQKGPLSLPDLEEVERRSGSAYRELHEATFFDWVLPNHDGEDSDNWEAFPHPLGEARRVMMAFAELLENKVPDLAEKWEADLFPSLS